MSGMNEKEQQTESTSALNTDDMNDLMKVAKNLFSPETLGKLSAKFEESDAAFVNEEIIKNVSKLPGLKDLNLNGLSGLNSGAGIGGLGSMFKKLTTSSSNKDDVNTKLKEILEKLNQMNQPGNDSPDNDSTSLLNEINGRLINLQSEMNLHHRVNQSISELQDDMYDLLTRFDEMNENLANTKKKKKKKD
ncbi:hypothetical protein [Ferdinandcohnia sp. Marseille-Q9671]